MDILIDKLKHPALNHSYIAEQLYGSRENKNRTKLSLKLSGKKGWQDWELKRLEEILAEIKKAF